MGRFKKRKRKFGEESHVPLKKEKRKMLGPAVFAVLVIGIMSMSVIGFIQGGDSNTVRLPYNDIKFTSDQDNNWIGKINDKEYLFYNHPLNVETIDIDEQSKLILKTSRSLILTSDENSTAAETIGLVGYELTTILGKDGIFVDYAFTRNNTFNKQVVNCNNLSNSVGTSIPVIYFTTGNETLIKYDNCIIAQASSPQDFLRIRDRILYSILKVIE